MIRQYQDFIAAYPIVSLKTCCVGRRHRGMALATRELGIETWARLFHHQHRTPQARRRGGAANSMVLKITQVAPSPKRWTPASTPCATATTFTLRQPRRHG
jgi:hypothetical protein